ncbi:MAG TPA: cytochrome c oxidase assembly factor Coa1 family protein [Fibrobacteria bacterium]|nr:cytochrome c oxidase assembly factor Coa1 family protein [Fibrobacteria bacterium]
MSQESSSRPPLDFPPREVRGWNWGAFFLNWIWGIVHGSWVGLLMFVPFVNLFVPFVMGSQGSRWAWENRKWRSLEQFKRVQRIWGWVGLAVWVVVGAGLVVTCQRIDAGLHGSGVHRLAIEQLDRSRKVEALLGRPLEVGVPLGTRVDSAGTGRATFSFQVRGPGGSGVVSVDAHKDAGEWFLDAMSLELDRIGETIDLIAEPGGDRSP